MMSNDADSSGPAATADIQFDESSSFNHAGAAIDIALAEYKSLRDEILKKMDNRTALIVSSITVSSAIIGFGLERSSSTLLLVAPLVSALLGTLVSHHNMQIGELAEYIRDNIERPLQSRVPGSIGWHANRVVFQVGFKHRILSYHLPLMLITVAPAAVALPLAWSHPESVPVTILLSLVDILLLAVYFTHIVRFRRRI